MFQISVVNRTRTVADLDLHRVVRAINRQVSEDFEPYWAFGGRLRVEGPSGGRVDTNALLEMRGDAVLYLLDSATSDDALGYHDRNLRGIPYGFVYLDLCAQLGDQWSTTLSHEALELIGDAQCNLLVQGPNPRDPSLPQVYHYFEMCDAVQAQVYEIDAVPVSNFVLPAYFTPDESEGTRKDFNGTGLRPFGVNPGGYIGFFDPNKAGGGGSDTMFADDRSRERYRIKSGAALPPDGRPRGRVARRQGTSVSTNSAQSLASAPQRGSAPLRSATAIDSAVDPIRHIVVLMLENRSFDHMLGGLGSSIQGLDGVDPTSPGSNIDNSTNTPFRQLPNAQAIVSKTFNVPHEFVDVQEQISGGMANFVSSFVKNNPDSTPQERGQVMSYFKEDDLPVLHALAKSYLVCNRWFSSLPGPTWPNRLFVHSGTSLGHVLMPNADNPAEIDQLLGTFGQDTIYDRLDNALGGAISWKIYHDGFPQSVILDHLKKPFLTGRYASIDTFAEDAKFESSFPTYVFVEPRFSNGLTRKENDQHPPSGVAEGEQLIASVYDAIRSNDALWRSTLLIVTYDEHGGLYDHVAPPAAIPPDASASTFAFDRFGVRVPAILVSPYVRRGCDDTLYDHTSVLRYVLEKYSLPALGDRTRASQDPRCVGNFSAQILPNARADADTLPAFSTSAARLAAGLKAAPPTQPVTPDNARRALLAVAEKMRALDQPVRLGAAVARVPATPPTDAGEFAARVESVDDWLAARLPGGAQTPDATSEPRLSSKELPARKDSSRPTGKSTPAAAPPAPSTARSRQKGRPASPAPPVKTSTAKKKSSRK